MAGADFPSMSFDGDSSQEDLLGRRETAKPFATHRRAVVAVAGLLAMVAAISVWQSPGSVKTSNIGLFMGLDEEDHVEGYAKDEGCGGMPFVRLDTVVSSNLAKKGPDHHAEEGIIYNASLHGTDMNISHLQIHIHSMSKFHAEEGDYDKKYTPEWLKGDYKNGKHGMFGAVNLKQGTSVKLQLHAYMADKKVDVSIPVGFLTFFDLDAGQDSNHSVEFVEVLGATHYFLTNETEIKATPGAETDSMRFTATKEGTGDDNPSDPTQLTVQQKNKAVTLKMENFNSVEFEIGASPGHTGRVFQFVLRPSLLCAKTKLADGSTLAAKGEGAPIEIVETPKSAAHQQMPGMLLALGIFCTFGQ